MSLPELALRRPVTMLMVYATLFILGAVALQRIPLEFLPTLAGPHFWIQIPYRNATPAEVALTYYVYPEAVKSVEMHPEIAPNGPIYDAEDYRRRFPDGRIGSNPALAKGADGAKLYEAAVEDAATDFHAFVGA